MKLFAYSLSFICYAQNEGCDGHGDDDHHDYDDDKAKEDEEKTWLHKKNVMASHSIRLPTLLTTYNYL